MVRLLTDGILDLMQFSSVSGSNDCGKEKKLAKCIRQRTNGRKQMV